MERINYIKPNKNNPGDTENGSKTLPIGPKSSSIASQPKVYRKIELCRASSSDKDNKKSPVQIKHPNEVDINKNVSNGDIIPRVLRRCSSASSSGQSSKLEKSMILVKKTYKQPEISVTDVAGPTKKVYKKKIFEPDLKLKRRLQDDTTENREEFYKYLGIDTKPPEKRVYRPEISNLDIFKRRSLRVRYLNIQTKTQSQEGTSDITNKNEINEEVDNSLSKEGHESKLEKGLLPRQHDVKVLRSYLKPKEKKTLDENLQKRAIFTPTVLIKPIKKVEKVTRDTEIVPVKYLMRSKINLSESRLRSGLQKKSLLRPSRYLSYFKNKRTLLRSEIKSVPRKNVIVNKKIKKNKVRSQTPEKLPVKTNTAVTATQSSSNVVVKPAPVKIPVEEKTVETTVPTTTTVELPKSPVPQVPDSTVNFQTPTTSHSLAIPAQVSTIDTMTSSAHTLKNPLNRDDGSVMYAYAFEETLVIVQEQSVSFWKYSPFKHLVGMDQTWELIGRTKRHDYGES